MSTGHDPNEVNLIEQARRQINRLAEEIAHLSEMDLPPAQYYGEFLQRLLTAIAAPAGAVWLRTPQGNLQLQYQINMGHVGLNRTEASREIHNKLLEEAFKKAQPGLIPPHSGVSAQEEAKSGPGNPTDFVILIAPIMVDKQVEGLVEVWQDPHRGPDAQRGFLQFLVRMAGLASGYTRNHQLRQMAGQQQVWTALESFARQVHASLNPMEVSYLVANEGRRLVECDRVSVAIRYGKRAHIEAISGADIVEKRSNLVMLMRQLIDSVLAWNEKLVYTGSKDEALPPNVLKALDAFLAESNSKLLVVLPLRDDREAESQKPARSALVMESFEPANAPEQLIARLEVVGRHSVSALYNASEYRRIPMRFLWGPLAALQEGLGGKARAIWTIVGVAFLALVLAMVFVPWSLRMEATGQLLPCERALIHPPAEGKVERFREGLKTDSQVFQEQELVLMYSPELLEQLADAAAKIEQADATVKRLTQRLQETNDAAEKATLGTQLIEAKGTYNRATTKLQDKRKLYNADPNRLGYFWLKSPLTGRILTADFREQLTGAWVKPSQPVLRVGKVDPKKKRLDEWEIELKIPQKHVGQVLSAFQRGEGVNGELDVDLLLRTRPTETFKGKLRRDKIAAEAAANRDENNEAEPVVLAWVRIHPIKNAQGEDDIPAAYRLPPELLLTGTEVSTRIRCGDHAMGYSLFYGVWEFIYENIVFFF
ncbi:MAG: efflux RND transporter periplasmic adaptor subunit [Gemmataceae bacterium]|nr:efflux RND transporter periplasmic adaptor subunit [Gemmataceae bacterium]